MSNYIIQGETLTSIADAIRAKTGETGAIAVTEMADKISGISAGSGETPEMVWTTVAEGYIYWGAEVVDTENMPSFTIDANKTYKFASDSWEIWSLTGEESDYNEETGMYETIVTPWIDENGRIGFGFDGNYTKPKLIYGEAHPWYVQVTYTHNTNSGGWDYSMDRWLSGAVTIVVMEGSYAE